MIKREKRQFNIIQRKKFCRFCKDEHNVIDYKDFKLLERLINDRGKILPTRITGTCARHQRKVAIAVKRARFVAFLPYVR